MVCRKIKCYNDLEVITDNYGQYIDFQYRAVFNIWSSVEDGDKYRSLGTMYINFLREFKKIREEYYKVQKTLYTMPSSSSFCGDECTCENLRDRVEREIFLRARNKLTEMNSKMRDFNFICYNSICNILEHKMSMLDRELNNRS